MDKHTITYTGGLDRDSSVNKYDNTHYYYSKNFRIVTQDELSTGALENILGTTELFTVNDSYEPSDTQLVINSNTGTTTNGIYTKLLETTILQAGYLRIKYELSAGSEGTTTNCAAVYRNGILVGNINDVGDGQPWTDYSEDLVGWNIGDLLQIYGYSFDAITSISARNLSASGTLSTADKCVGLGVSQDEMLVFTHNPDNAGHDKIKTYNLTDNTSKIIYTADLGFSSTNQITSILGVYENSNIHKIYWSIAGKELGSINILDTDINTKSITHVYYLKEATIPQVLTTNVLSGGALKAGKVQYSFQYYNLHGQTSYYSPLTVPMYLTLDTMGSTFSGSTIGTDTNKSVKLTVRPDYDYDKLRVISLFTENYSGSPTVNIIGDYDITTGVDITFIDSGVNYTGSLLIEELLAQSPYFYPSYIESFKNFLFASNIQYDVFDFDYDARAYRFTSSSPTMYVYQDATHRIIATAADFVADIATYQTWSGSAWIDGDVIKITTIPEDYNCINYYNDIVRDGVTSIQYFNLCKYTYYSNGDPIFGGSGKNVSYAFSTGAYLNVSTLSANKNASPYTYRDAAQLDPGEVYRLGIVGYDINMRNSPVKWIGDVRAPELSEFNPTTGCKLNLTITVNNLPTEVISYRIVYVKRSSEDRNVVMSGLLCGYVASTYNGTSIFDSSAPITERGYTVGSMRFEPTPAAPAYRYDKYISKCNFSFYSPEVSFLGRKAETGDYLEIAGNFLGSTSAATKTGINSCTLKCGSIFYLETTTTSSLRRTVTSSFLRGLEVDGTTMTMIDPTVNGGTITTDNRFFINDTRYLSSAYTKTIFSGTNNHITIDSAFALVGTGTNPALSYNTTGLTWYPLFAKIRRDVFNSQYGGNTYNARSVNDYISLSDITIKGSNATCFGDSWFTMFYVLAGYSDDTVNHNTFYEFPTYSQVLTEYRSDKITKYAGSIKLCESKWYAESIDLVYPGDMGDLYQYNNVYSRPDDVVSVSGQLQDSNNELEYPYRVLSSSKKTYGENIDSFSIFKVLNYIDLDSRYGELTKLITYNSQLFFFQKRAFGILSVEPRVITNTLEVNNSSAITTALGTGGVLDRYDYISVTTGTSFPNSVVITDSSLFWYDDLNKMFYVFNANSITALSDVKGIYSYFKNMEALNDVVCCYDKKYKEILISFIKTDGTFETLLYNQLFNCFSGFTSHEVLKAVKYGSTLVSTPDDTYLYTHNTGDRNYFYDGYENSELTLLLTPIPNSVCRFNILEWLDECDTENETFATLRMYNDYQDTGTITLSTSPDLVRRFRTWRINNLRDNTVDSPRLKDSHVFVHLVYTGNDDKYIVHDISVLFDTVDKKPT
jgi:hypothetical protein